MINKIPETPLVQPEPQHDYQVQVKDMVTGEVIYEVVGKGGVLCTMEQFKSINPQGEVEGVHQNMGWGNPIIQMYCFDQLKNFLSSKLPELMDELRKYGVKI